MIRTWLEKYTWGNTIEWLMQAASIYTLPVREREQLTSNDIRSLLTNEIICYSKQSLVPK